MKIFHHKSQRKWDKDLHLLAFAFNTIHLESTKFCPARFFLESGLATPLESVSDLTETNISRIWKKKRGFRPRQLEI